MHVQANKRWKALELKLTDATNEAKDNVKYLTSLEKALEVMYGGSPQDVLDNLRNLMSNIMTLYKIARYYGTPERMTILFVKITNQMIKACKETILAPGKMWDQNKLQLVANMQVSRRGWLWGHVIDMYACALTMCICMLQLFLRVTVPIEESKT
jgi:dynein heavy chain